eukprot:gene3855-4210_t
MLIDDAQTVKDTPPLAEKLPWNPSLEAVEQSLLSSQPSVDSMEPLRWWNYLYRFESEVGDRVKGSPIPVDSCCATSSSSKTSQSSTNSVDVEAEGAPYFVVTTIRKRYVFIVETAEEAQEWVEAIKLRKFLSVKENMGHAPLTEEVRRMNQRASRLVDKKLISERKEAEEATGNPVLTPSF